MKTFLPSVPSPQSLVYSGRGIYAMLVVLSSTWTLGLESVVVAQPAGQRPPNSVQLPPLKPEQKAAASNAIELVRMAERVASPVRLRVTNASLEDIAARIKRELIPSPPIEVRQATPARFTLDIQGIAAGQVLDSVAALAECKLYVLSNRLVIAPANEPLNGEEAEAQSWTDFYDAKGIGGSGLLKAESKVNEALFAWFDGLRDAGYGLIGNDAGQPANSIQVRLKDLSPDLQRMVQYKATSIARHSPNPNRPPLSGDTVISFGDTEQGWARLDIRSMSQGQHYIHDRRRR